MELLATLRLLWAHRRLVAVGAVLAVAAAFVLGKGGGGTRTVGTATAGVMLDTPSSQLLNVEPKGAETLPTRSLLFANLMARESIKAEIARAAGVDPRELDVLPPTVRQEPAVSTPLVDQAEAVAAAPRAPYIVNVYADGIAPMITIDAQAGDRATALALVQAATESLTAMLAKTVPGQPSRFRADVVTPPSAKDVVTRSRRPVLAAAVGFVLFLAWVGAILVGTGLARWLSPRAPRPAA